MTVFHSFIQKAQVAALLVCLFFAGVQGVRAVDCEALQCNSSDAEDEYRQCLEDKKSCLQDKISETKTQKNTLTNAISIMNTKINIQQIQINQIQAEINALEREIDGLTERISGLNVSLDRMSTMLVERVREQYKQSRVSPFTLLAGAESFDEFHSRIEYLNQASGQTVTGMQRAELQRMLYDQQKELKEEKQEEVEAKRVALQREKNALNQQRAAEQALLQETNNNEARYQQLLNEAEAQLASFKKFASNATGSSIIAPDSLGVGYDGSYFSQRDSRWGNNRIGSSSYTISEVGCLITSVAMVLKSQGVSTNPGEIAANSQYFSVGTAMMKKRYSLSLPGGKTGASIGKDKNSINEQLDKGNAVIVGIYAGPYGTHFVVLKKRDGDNWIMYDPWYGPDISFTSRYSVGSIYSAEIIK